MRDRESVISRLEEADRRMRNSGLQREWFKGADEKITAVAGCVNGALLEALLQATDYADVGCCELFRH
eukprot:721886-Karenia_brevis.AAC.1